jgi:hypothetical protein
MARTPASEIVVVENGSSTISSFDLKPIVFIENRFTIGYGPNGSEPRIGTVEVIGDVTPEGRERGYRKGIVAYGFGKPSSGMRGSSTPLGRFKTVDAAIDAIKERALLPFWQEQLKLYRKRRS